MAKPTEVAALVKTAIDDALQFSTQELTEFRTKAARYYRAEKFGDEQQGRSQVVMPEVRDGILAVLPSLVRVFHGPQRVCEFVPRGPGQQEAGRRATRIVEDIYLRRSKGYKQTQAVLKDGLLKRLGVFKWGFTPREETTRHELGPFPDVETANAGLAAAGLPTPSEIDFNAATGMLTVTITQTVKDPWVEAVPPEEFLFSRAARSLEDAGFVGHAREMRNGELVGMGIDKAVVEAHEGTANTLTDSQEAVDRRTAQTDGDADEDSQTPWALKKTLYVEGYMMLPATEGRVELRRVCTIGPGHHIVSNEPATAPRFAVFAPDLEPHQLQGWGWADRLMDMQEVRSRLFRLIFDSASSSLYNRTAVSDRVNVQDVLNPEVGGVVRVEGSSVTDAIMPLTTPFIGKEGLMLDQSVGQVIQRRTGRDMGTAGLDANALQSSTREGVQQVLASSQEQIELLARNFAELAFKPMFVGLFRMLHEEQIAPFIIQDEGQWVEVDPTTLDPDMEVDVTVALGTTAADQKVQRMMLYATKQEQIVQVLGPGNEVCGLPMLVNTFRRIVEANGENPDDYFKALPPTWQPQPQPPQKSPEEVLAETQLQIEQMKVQKELEIKEAELALKEQEAKRTADLEAFKVESERALAEEKMRMERDLELEKARIRASTELQVARIRAEMDAAKAAADVALRGSEQLHGQAMEEERVAIERTKASKPTGGAA